MRQGLCVLVGALLVASSCLLAATSSTGARGAFKTGIKRKNSEEGHSIKVTEWGHAQAAVERVKARLTSHAAVRKYLAGTESRLLSFDFVDAGAKVNGSFQPPDGYRATFFDYTNNRAIVASGSFKNSKVKASVAAAQPDPNDEEFNAAVAVLAKDPKLGPAILSKSLEPYQPMPPLVNGSLAPGKVERTVAVGLAPKDSGAMPEIVGVNMVRHSIVRFEGLAPAASLSTSALCGVSNAAQATTGKGTAGQYQVIISRGGTEIWNFIAVRPSASSGTRGSGVELLNVNYLGKRVLARAHTPILNVQYDRSSVCGPYRDWNYQEGMLAADGEDVAPGFRLCTSQPKTVLDTDDDLGNFLGVAVWDNKEEVYLVSEMQAGWYRYLSAWTLTDGGVIRPRFGFGATFNSCVCDTHTHHVYWRFDFDILTPANNSVIEVTPSGSTALTAEGARPNLYGTSQSWVIQNEASAAGESCTLIPGANDGNYDKYGRFDLMVLLNKPAEIDDGVNCTAGCATQANLAPFADGEAVSNADVVVWYGAHFNHHDQLNGAGGLTGNHALGPTLVLNHY